MADDKITENAVAKGMASSLATLKNIEKGITNLSMQSKMGAEEQVETTRAEKKSADNEEKTIGLLGGILKSLGLKAQKDKTDEKKSGGLLSLISKVVGFGMLGLSTAFFGAFGVLAGTIKAVIDSPAFSVVKGLFKIGKKIFSPFLGMFKGLGGIGKAATALMENPTVIKVMGATSKFLKPFMRIASWLFMGWEFFKGWKNADKIFGKEEGDATIFEKFAAGLGGVVSFLTFDLIPLETAAKSLKDTFDFLVLAWKEPDVAWAKVKDWWTDFSFDKTVVQPMVKMFEEFPQTVRKFIDGPLSNFGKKITTTIKEFIFGKEGEEGEGTGESIWSNIKSFFSAENVVKAVTGVFKIGAAFYKMLGSLISIPLIGTQGNWTELSSWGGLLGWIKDEVFNWGNIKGVISGTLNVVGSVATWLGDIFAGLFTAAMDWMGGLFDTKKMLANIKKNHPILAEALDVFGIGTGEEDAAAKAEEARRKKQQEEARRKKQQEEQRKLDEQTGGGFFNDIKQSFGFGPKIKEEPKGQSKSAVKTSPKKVPLKGIDWSFISKEEGGSLTDGYVPNPEGSKSGVTIATGFDLGARSMKDLAGLPASLKSKLAPYLGMQGMVAKLFLDKNPLTITKSQAGLIDKLSKGQALKRLKSEWNKNASFIKDGKKFEDLTGAQKTAVASVAFQYGSLSKAPKFRDAAMTDNWDGAIGELRNFGDDYGSRRNREADYLLAARQNRSGQTLGDLTEENQYAKANMGKGGTNVVAPNNSQTNINNTTQPLVMRTGAGDPNDSKLHNEFG